MNNDFYLAIQEGRYPIDIDTALQTDGLYKSSFISSNGQAIEAVDSNRSEAHRQCTAKVIEGIREGRITPTR